MILLALASLARAFDSEPQPIDLVATADLFNAIEVSTGLLPSADSPLAVEVGIVTNGGATVEMAGEANVSWPYALQLAMTGTPESGVYTLDTSVDAVTTAYVNVFGYADTFEIDRRSLPITGDTTFSPFRLGERLEVVDAMDSLSLIDYSTTVLGVVEFRFLGSMTPVVTAGYTSLSWTAGGSTSNADGTPLSLGAERAPAADVEATLRGLWDARLDLVLTPSMEACIDVWVYSDCFDVASFDFPIEVGGDTVEQDFPVQALHFPLPMLELGVQDGDFGDVVPGSSANLQVPLRNLGELAAEGTLSIRGDAAFTVFPTTFSAAAEAEDGAIVTFTPTADGPVSAELVVTSNDPTQPEIVLALLGNGATPVGDDVVAEDGAGEGAEGKVSGCGCSAGDDVRGSAMLALGAGAMLLVRRRRGARG